MQNACIDPPIIVFSMFDSQQLLAVCKSEQDTPPKGKCSAEIEPYFEDLNKSCLRKATKH